MTKSAFEHNIRISLAHHMIIPAIFLAILIILLSRFRYSTVFFLLLFQAVKICPHYIIAADISAVMLIRFITPVTIT